MKNYLFWILFVSIPLLASSCQSSYENDSGDCSSQSIVFEARSYFENYISKMNQVKDEIVGLHPGNIVPEWDKAKVTTQSGTICVNVPFIAQITYEGSFFVQEGNTDFLSSKETYYTALYQRLIVVKDIIQNKISCYIATMIPDKKNATMDAFKIDKMFYSGDLYTHFSGTVIYSTVGTNYTIVVEKYNNGEKYENVSLFKSTKASYQTDLKDMSAIISASNIKRKIATQTKAMDKKEQVAAEIELPEVVVIYDGGGGGGPDFQWPTDEPDNYWPEPPTSVPPPTSGGGGGGYNGNNGNDNNSKGDDNDPCVTAKLLTGNKDFKHRADSILTNLKTNTKEEGWMKDTKGEIIIPKSSTNNEINFSFDTSKDITEYFHSHPSGTPTLSQKDIYQLVEMYNKGYLDVGNFTCGIVSKSGCFVVVISDETKFKQFSQFDNNLRERYLFEQKYREYFEYNPQKVNTPDKWMNQFIEFMKSYNSGLSFIVAPSNSSYTSLGNFGVHSKSTSNCNK